MYINPAFRMNDGDALALAEARGFGLIVACDGAQPAASWVPFLLLRGEGRPRVEFHVARANPLASQAERQGRWLLAVQGADAYVSPDWYASHDQVPTWLYEAAHLSGPVRVLSADEKAAHLDRLSNEFEGRLAPKPVWRMDKISPGRLQALMAATVAIEMIVETIEGSRKLNQHKADADHVGVANALAGRDEQGPQGIAERMIALRPHLTYG